MQTITSDAVILEKTQELCRIILAQPEIKSLRDQVEAFLSNETARQQYQHVTERGEYLQHKQSQGVRLTDDEIQQFEKAREQLFNNPVARGFLDAQQAMHRIQETVSQYVGKSFELGRIPQQDDFESGHCGPSCGCGH